MQNNHYRYPWQQSSQQINHQQIPPPFMNQQQAPPVQASSFAVPPPPPPENQPQPSSEPMQQHQNMRKQSNFGQGFNDNRGQQNYNNNNRAQSFRGSRRGNSRGNNRFGGDNNMMQHSNDMNNTQKNFGNQRGNLKNMNQNNRNRNNNYNNSGTGNNNMNYNNNAGPSSNMNYNAGAALSSNETAKFTHDASQITSSPNFSFNANATGVDSFEDEFKKWEEQFENWLKEMKDHPDKQQYETYKKHFLEYREMLSTRLQKLKEKAPAMTEDQIKFKNQWNAGDPSKKTETNNESSTANPSYGAATTAVEVPNQSFAFVSETPHSALLFGKKKGENAYENVDYSRTSYQDNSAPRSSMIPQNSFANICYKRPSLQDNSVQSGLKENLFLESPMAIPGLTITQDEPETKIVEDIIVIDFENKSELPPPPLPSFCLKKSRHIINIDDILEEPGRLNRCDKNLIIIRGAPGSGKHYLAKLIYDREKEMENERCRILSHRRFYESKIFDSNLIEKYEHNQFTEFQELVQEGYVNFFIVVLGSCGIRELNRFVHHIQHQFQFGFYSIEIHQKNEICEKYNIYKRSQEDIQNANDDLIRFSTPLKHKLLDATSLYYPREQAPKVVEKPKPVQMEIQPEQQSFTLQEQPTIDIPTETDTSEDFAKKMTQILQNKNVLQLLQAQMNNPQSNFPIPAQQQTQTRFPPFTSHNNIPRQHFPPQPASIDDCPTFKSSKVVDYNHLHKKTLDESLMEFRVFRTIDYSHMTSAKLSDFVREVDVDRIIEKRKAVALRKKILEYLRNAERPEDTVSNPKYPRNWEVIKVERPPRKSKRRKRLTAKIKRILMIKANDENSWMTKGYVRDESSQMDLEAISSEDDDMEVELKCDKKTKVDDLFKFEYQDEYKDVIKTIPDFNRFNHQHFIDIRNLFDQRKRPAKILIIMRGVTGSGKSHLVKLIKQKEIQMGNASDIRILSIDDYFLTDDNEDCEPAARLKLTQNYLDSIQKHLKKTIANNLHNFIIINAENCDLNSYNQFYQIGLTKGFSVYTIELFQTLDICSKQSKRASAIDDIPKSIEMLTRNRIPEDHTLIIASALYEEFNCLVNPALSGQTGSEVENVGEKKKDDLVVNYQNYLVQTIDDDYLSMMPQFNWHNREILDIKEVLDEPARSKRSKNIAILMRGPGGAGKTELASKILEKERKNGNENVQFISIEDFFINETTRKLEFNCRTLEMIFQQLVRKLLELMRSKAYNFIIVDVETGDFCHYTQIYDLLSKQNQCYTIEMYQDASICAENDVHKRSIKDIESVLEEMHLKPTPNDHILLDASLFYKHQPTIQDRPLKSALKISPNASINVENLHSTELEKCYDKQIATMSLSKQCQIRFSQRISINGTFIERNSSPPTNLPEFNWFNVEITDMRDILEEPGRLERSDKITVFIRGAPASGKSYLARLVERKELEKGNGDNFHLLSMDDFFERPQFRETDFDGQFEKYIECSADPALILTYMQQLVDKFTNTLKNVGDKSFIVLDGDFCELKFYNQMWELAIANDFNCFVVELNQDDNTCLKYNDHKWNESFIVERNKIMQEIESPEGHVLLDPEYLYHEYSYEFYPEGDVFSEEYEMDEHVDDFSSDENNQLSFGKFKMGAEKSKWDDYETPDIERLDGIKNKSLSGRVTMADYLQTDDANEWSMRPSNSGKKRVRWADIEEKKEQERMRKIGFIVGQTDWNRMTDESDGKSALEKTKFIERRHKK